MREIIQAQGVQAIIENNFQGIVDVAPRVGKSKIAIDALETLVNCKVLITAPYNIILNSWHKEFQKWGLDKHNIDVINQRSLDKYDISSYKVIICDEVHTLSERQRKLLHGKNILGFSGSISKKTKKILKDEFDIKPIYTYTIDQAIADNIISDYKITILQCRLDNTNKYINAGNKDKQFKTTEYKNYQYLTSMFDRFKAMAWKKPALNNVKMSYANKRASLLYKSNTKINACKHFMKQLDRSLIFTTRTDVADILGEKSYHSKVSENTLEQFIEGDINQLAVCEMTSMGITIPNLKIGVFHQMRSSEEGSIQKILRMCNWEEGETAQIYIFMYVNTKDEEWVMNAIKPFDQSKIEFLNMHKLIK